MIPTLAEIATELGVAAAIVPVALAGLFTGFVLLAQSAVRWFEDRNLSRTKLPKKGETLMPSLSSNADRSRWLVVLILCAALLAGPLCSAASEAARVVKYSREDIVPVHAKLRFSTLIVLPDDEEILDFTTGDREFWIINGSHNLCYVHPAQAGIRSNLNLITSSGHVYSFLLTEISGDSSLEPDLKLFVEPKEGSASTNPLRGYVRAADVEAYKKELETVYNQASEQVRAAQAHAAEQVNQFRSAYATKLRFDYTVDSKFSREPFLVSAIYHDDTFTYVRCAAREKPALYEMKDGKPNLVPFQIENGVYIVAKIVDAGFLTVGKKRLNFTRQAAAK